MCVPPAPEAPGQEGTAGGAGGVGVEGEQEVGEVVVAAAVGVHAQQQVLLRAAVLHVLPLPDEGQLLMRVRVCMNMSEWVS